ncbi:MAG: hypothetical protein R6V86_02750 [Spirochaetia bacterium]
MLSSDQFSFAPAVKAISLWVGQELLGFLYSHHQALTRYAPARPLAISAAMGATRKIITEQVYFLKSHLME